MSQRPANRAVAEVMIRGAEVGRITDPVVEVMKTGREVGARVVGVQSLIREMVTRAVVKVNFAGPRFRPGTKRSLRLSTQTSRTTASPVATEVVGAVAVEEVRVEVEADPAEVEAVTSVAVVLLLMASGTEDGLMANVAAVSIASQVRFRANLL